MAKAKFLCVSKTGKETFTVHLEPVAELVSPACPECGTRSHMDFCFGPVGPGLKPHDPPVELKEGDTSFFKDLPQASLFLSVLTPEAAAEFEVGKLTEVSFKLVP